MITNKDRFPDVDFLPESEIRQIGTIGGFPLVLVGFETGFAEGQKNPIVARSYSSDPTSEDLFATPLVELMTSQDPIAITEEGILSEEN